MIFIKMLNIVDNGLVKGTDPSHSQEENFMGKRFFQSGPRNNPLHIVTTHLVLSSSAQNQKNFTIMELISLLIDGKRL